MLKVGITSVEFGATKGFVEGIRQTTDFTSGYYADTIPTSGAGLVGYYARQYVDAFFEREAYNPERLSPIPLQ